MLGISSYAATGIFLFSMITYYTKQKEDRFGSGLLSVCFIKLLCRCLAFALRFMLIIKAEEFYFYSSCGYDILGKHSVS